MDRNDKFDPRSLALREVTMHPHYNPPGIIYIADMTALVTLIGSFAGELPTIAAGLAALWYLIAIVDAVRRWFRKPLNK